MKAAAGESAVPVGAERGRGALAIAQIQAKSRKSAIKKLVPVFLFRLGWAGGVGMGIGLNIGLESAKTTNAKPYK